MDLGTRLVVVGTSGSGKTTMATRLARVLAVAATTGDGWVVDGNYSAVRDVVWPRATAIIWLDYDRGVVMRRVLWRSVERAVTRRPLWNDNRERASEWLAPDHPIRWAWRTHADRRVRFEALLDPRWVRLRSPAEARRWLSRFATR